MTRATGRVAAVVVLLLALPACSTVPSNSPTVQITQAPARPLDEIGIEPLAPEPGETPDDIVRGFIEAARLPGGWLQVWGQPGAGAQFRLTLPLTDGGELTSSPLPLRPAVVRRPGGLA